MSNIYTNKMFSSMVYYVYGDKMYAYENDTNKFYEVRQYRNNIYEYEQKKPEELPERVLGMLKKIRRFSRF